MSGSKIDPISSDSDGAETGRRGKSASSPPRNARPTLEPAIASAKAGPPGVRFDGVEKIRGRVADFSSFMAGDTAGVVESLPAAPGSLTSFNAIACGSGPQSSAVCARAELSRRPGKGHGAVGLTRP